MREDAQLPKKKRIREEIGIKGEGGRQREWL